MEWKTSLKKVRREVLDFGAASSRDASRSRIVVVLRATVLPSARQARTQRTLNCVLPKNQTYFGRSMSPAMKPMMLPTPVTRLAMEFAASCW